MFTAWPNSKPHHLRHSIRALRLFFTTNQYTTFTKSNPLRRRAMPLVAGRFPPWWVFLLSVELHMLGLEKVEEF